MIVFIKIYNRPLWYLKTGNLLNASEARRINILKQLIKNKSNEESYKF